MIIGDKISTKLFSYDPKLRLVVTGAPWFRGLRFMGQLWDDSADLGFVMVSEKTGEEVPFWFHAANHNESEILYWDFISYGLTPEVPLGFLTTKMRL